MTTLALGTGPHADSAPIVEQVAQCVAELALLAGDGCLVETTSGRLVAHELVNDDVPPALLKALVRGELATLHSALTHRRTTGLLSSGAVVESRLDGTTRRVAYLALRDAITPVGGLWLLPTDDRPLSLEDLSGPVQRLARLLACTSAADVEPSLLACLDGTPGAQLPTAIADADRLWVAALSTGAQIAPEALVRAVVAASRHASLRMRPVQSGRRVYVVIAGAQRTSGPQVQRAVQAALDAAGTQLGQPVSAGLSEPGCPLALPVARRQAEVCLSSASAGRCAALAVVRARVVVQHAAQSLASLPDLGPDPLHQLADYDERRGSDLAVTLLAWLDAFGDVPTVTEVLSVHSNTLRYRVKRIQEITGVDLRCDPSARLELHLRLRARALAEGVV
jgi:hypothetical protein